MGEGGGAASLGGSGPRAELAEVEIMEVGQCLVLAAAETGWRYGPGTSAGEGAWPVFLRPVKPSMMLAGRGADRQARVPVPMLFGEPGLRLDTVRSEPNLLVCGSSINH